MPCVAVSAPLCCVNMNVLNQKVQLLTFKSYLNDRKHFTPPMYISGPLTISQVSWSTFVLYICRITLIAMNWCLFMFVYLFFFWFFLQVLCLSLCIIPLLYMYYLSVVVVNNMQCFFSSSIYLWWRPAKMSGKRSIHTHKAIITWIVAFWGTYLVKSGCDGCLMLSSPQISLRLRKHWHIHNEVKRYVTHCIW